MIIVSYFLKGGILLIINGPLLLLFVVGELFSRENYPTYLYLKHLPSVAVITIFLTIVGFMITPVERLLGDIVIKHHIASPRIFLYDKSDVFKTSLLLAKGRIRFLENLAENPSWKLLWEWEFFHYSLAWTWFFSLSIASFITIFFVYPDFNITFFSILLIIGRLIIFLLLVNLFAYYPIYRSIQMKKIHDHVHKLSKPNW